jgi:hypothetical protein
MRRLARVAALALLAVAPLAPADIVLDGNFHVGDEDTRVEFTPMDPVDCDKYRSNPTTFHLSEAATITGFTLHDAIDLDNATFTLDIDGVQRSALSCTACDLCEGTSSCGDVTIGLVTGVSLAAGTHTAAVVDPSGASGNCNTGNNIGWSKLTLVSAATTTSIMLSQRRHIGDSADTDDDYDTNDTANPFYPDPFEGDPITQLFTLGEARRLTEVRLYKLRDLDTNDTVVKVDGTTLGTLANTGDPYEANPTAISTSLLLAAGTHAVTVDAGNLAALSIDDFSWDDIILRFAGTTAAGTPGFFNAVDVGGNALTGSITTRIAGDAFTLDLYALNGFGTGQETTYNGGADVVVLNAADSSGTTDIYGCNSQWQFAQGLGSVTFVGGKAQVSGTFLTAGLQNARIQVTDSTTGARGCSIDNFAIRPASLEVSASHDTELLPGITTALNNTTTGGTPRHRAGRPFTIVATGKASGGTTTASNYNGSPTAAAPVVIAPATVAGTLSLGSWGTASGGARRTDEATYSEVGAVTINLEDTSWADVDADDTAAAQRTITGSGNAGRFVPDHFRVTDGALAPSCTAFSYLGSTLAWASPAMTLTAENASNQTTQNYSGTLMRLAASDVGTPAYSAPTGVLSTLGTAVSITTPAAGQAAIGLPALQFARTLMGAFDAEILVEFPEFDGDADDIRALEDPLKLGETGGVAFTGNARSQRFGRLYFEPKYGSELLPMDVPLRAEYFDGVTFVPNLADTSCTNLDDGNVTLAGFAGQTHTVDSLGNGAWRVRLSAPGAGQTGPATLTFDRSSTPPGITVPYALLSADTNNDGTYAEDPVTTVTFGKHTQDDRRIYQREVVGN